MQLKVILLRTKVPSVACLNLKFESSHGQQAEERIFMHTAVCAEGPLSLNASRKWINSVACTESLLLLIAFAVGFGIIRWSLQRIAYSLWGFKMVPVILTYVSGLVTQAVSSTVRNSHG